MTYRLVTLAAQDLADAVNYYERQVPGLGASFLDEFSAAINRIFQTPDAWRRVSPNHRRNLMRRFPYAVIYHQRGTDIIVTGIMHVRMGPEEQRRRMG